MANAFQPGAFQVGAFQTGNGLSASAALGITAGLAASSSSVAEVAGATIEALMSIAATPGAMTQHAGATLAVKTLWADGKRLPAFQAGAFQSSAFQTFGYVPGSIFAVEYAAAPALGAALAAQGTGIIPITASASLGISMGMAPGAIRQNAVGPGIIAALLGISGNGDVTIGPFVPTTGQRLYKPPTRVVTREEPYLALVTQVDPLWANRKFREVQYEFTNRRILFNPYVGGAYNNYDNIYPVGAQYGPLDPDAVPLTAVNIGATASTGQQVAELPRTSAGNAGALVIIVVADGSAPANIPADAFTDGANQYKVLLSIARNGSPTIAIAYALLQSAIPKNALISYVSPNVIGVDDAIVIAGLIVTGGVQGTVFDPAVTLNTFGTGQTPTVTSGEPAQGGELFLGISAAALDGTFSADGQHGWLALQQAAAVGTIPVCLCTSVQSGPNFDPGSNASVIFSPGLSGIAAWSAIVLGVRSNKPAYSGSDDGKGWA